MTLEELLRMPVTSVRRQFYGHIIAAGHLEKVFASESIDKPGRAWCEQCGWSYDTPRP